MAWKASPRLRKARSVDPGNGNVPRMARCQADRAGRPDRAQRLRQQGSLCDPGRVHRNLHEQICRLAHGLTGALSKESAAHRVNETAIFFTTTVMPDSLDRHGATFKAAAMVRLMHCDGTVQHPAARRPLGRQDLRHPRSPKWTRCRQDLFQSS